MTGRHVRAARQAGRAAFAREHAEKVIDSIGAAYALSMLLPFKGLHYITSHLPVSLAATALPA